MYANMPTVFPRGRFKFAPTDNDDVQTRTRMWLRMLEILANTAVGEVYASATASPQSHLTSLENVLHKVNSGQYYSTV